MTARLLAQDHGASVYHATWHELLDVVPRCNALFADTPYSEKTHKGHGTVERWGKGVPPTYDGGERRELNYGFWTPADVRDFVEAWSPRTDGWFVSITDDVLAPVWREELERQGRFAFAPLPYVAPGSRVRLTGDGPSCWTTWIVAAGTEDVVDRYPPDPDAGVVAGPCEVSAQIVVARPRTREMSRWGTLDGAYVLPQGKGERLPVVGGKQPWLMQRIAEDYSRPGNLIVDPTGGAGTTAIGAIRAGGDRRVIVGDMNEAHAGLAAQWIQRPTQRAPTLKPMKAKGGQSLLAI